jgi:ferredoxin, 2Fe-2S
MVRIVFVESDGTEKVADAEIGETVMTVAVRNNVAGIEGECGGQMSCATCHVQPRAEWDLPVASSEEADMLESVFHRNERSRLGCQIRIVDSLDGLTLDVPPAE